MNNVTVIGGCGFIGSRLVKRLLIDKNISLNIVDKVSSRLFPDLVTIADVRSVEQLRGKLTTGSVIINLAAEHRDDVRPLSLYSDVNIDGARNICTVAREKNINTIIFTSTVAVYGFAPVGTNESGNLAPFNEYGRTKSEAELIFKAWQAEAPQKRSLVIIRPTVVFGEQNRGNVYNLFKQIASGKFVMVGSGKNRKSMAYVENVAAFIQHSLDFKAGLHIFNYVDKPDFMMTSLASSVSQYLLRSHAVSIKIPFSIGYLIGLGFDLVAYLTGKKFPVSAIRVKKFCANSVYDTAVAQTGFVAPVPLEKAIEQTIRHEFIENHENEGVFYTE